MEKAVTKISELTFDINESILYIKIKEGTEMDLENSKEHYEIIKKLTRNKPYAALIDATIYYTINKEALEYTSLPGTIDGRIASAHCNPNSANMITANFFRVFHKPPIPFQIFKSETEALEWLKMHVRATKAVKILAQ